MKKALLVAVLMGVTEQGWAGDECNDALRALMRIQARAEIGVSSADFDRLLGDANLEVKLCAASKVGLRKPKAVEELRSAITAYSDAGAISDLRRRTRGVRTGGYIPASDSFYQFLLRTRPALMKDQKEGGVLVVINGESKIEVDVLLSHEWARAEAKTKAAAALL